MDDSRNPRRFPTVRSKINRTIRGTLRGSTCGMAETMAAAPEHELTAMVSM